MSIVFVSEVLGQYRISIGPGYPAVSKVSYFIGSADKFVARVISEYVKAVPFKYSSIRRKEAVYDLI